MEKIVYSLHSVHPPLLLTSVHPPLLLTSVHPPLLLTSVHPPLLLTSGLLVAPTITTLADKSVPAPSNWTKNSVLILLEASFSSEDLWQSKESTSSMNTTDGCLYDATANNVRTVFSPSPIHLDVSDDALMLKNVAPAWWAIAFPMRVLPF